VYATCQFGSPLEDWEEGEFNDEEDLFSFVDADGNELPVEENVQLELLSQSGVGVTSFWLRTGGG